MTKATCAEQAAPPTPDPSPPRAARAGGGERRCRRKRLLISPRRLRSVSSLSSEPDTHAAARRRDLRLILAARAARNFGDGFAVIILPAYLTAIGYAPAQIGLIAGALLMAATGLTMPNAQHIALILLIAFIGTMNPSTGDMGVLVPIEHTLLAREAADRERTKVFARYSLIGAIATAAGALAAATPD